MSKKLLALLMAIMMIVSLVPFSAAVAAEGTNENIVMAYTTPLGTYGSNAQHMGHHDNSLHLAYSEDGGANWTPLNDGKGVLYYFANAGRTSGNSLQFCDPYIFQKADGTYVLLATALRYNQAHSNTQVIYWDSTDMVTWSNQKLINLGDSGVYPTAPQVFANEDGTYSIVWKQYNTENVFVNIASADFAEVGAAAAYEGTAYPQAYPAGVSVEGAPAGSIGCVVAVDEKVIDDLVAAYGTPAEVPVGSEDITVDTIIGTPAELPATGIVEYADGSKKEVNVTWEEQTPAQYNSDGTYTVTGFVEGGAAYLNPFHKNGADPDIFKGPDGYYYYTSSYMDPEHTGNAEYQYDRVNIRRSKTINGLAEAEDRTIFWRTESGTGSYHLWAPEIHYVQFEGEEQGTWVVYFASGLRGNSFYLNNYALVCDSQDPMTGNWSEPIIMKAPNQTTNFDIDATVFEFYGKWYRIDSSKTSVARIAISELTSITTVGDQVILAEPRYTFENRNDRVLEGATVMRANGYVYLCYAAGSTDATYCLGMMMAKDDPSTDLMNPDSWTRLPYPIAISNPAASQFGPGHATFTVSEDGQTPLLSYMTRPEEGYANNPLYVANRWARMAVVYFHENGVPYIAPPPVDGYIPGSTITATVNVQLTGEAAELKEIAQGISIHNADNVKGNIYLPESIENIPVTWTSSDETIISTAKVENENYDATPAGVVTRPAKDTVVTLTATLIGEEATYSKGFDVTVKAAVEPIAREDANYYVEMYFTDPSKDIYFATSEDGFNFKVINGGKPMISTHGTASAIVSENVGDEGLRDPFMIRSKEGDKYYILATDLDASGGNWGNYATRGSVSLVIYESDDLVNWSNSRLIPMVDDGNETFGCVWAPEGIYDEVTGEYVVYYSMHEQSSNRKQVYYSKTRDFVNFTDPELFVSYDNSGSTSTGVIDTSIHFDEDTKTYYRFTKDERRNYPFVHVNSGRLLDDSWERKEVTVNGTGSSPLEGQTAFRLHPEDVLEGYSDVVLMIDEYGGNNRRFIPFVTEDFDSLTFQVAPDYTKAAGACHGTVIPITEAEYTALMEAYSSDDSMADITKPIAYYSFDDAENLGASTIEGTDLAEYNDPSFAEEGAINGAAYLGGTDQYFQFPDALTSRDIFSIATWVKIENDAQWARILDLGGGQGNTMFLTNRDDSGKLHLDLNISNNYDAITVNQLPTGEWAHLAIAVDSDSYHLFVNGERVGSAGLGSRKLSSLDGLKSYIGKSQYSDPYFNGWVDEMYVYDQTLGTADVRALMKKINECEEPILYYDFDAANIDGTTIKDMSGHGNDGQLVNNATVSADSTPYESGEALYIYNNNVQSSADGQHVSMPSQILADLENVTITVWYQETLTGGSSTQYSRVWDFGTGPSGTGQHFFYLTTQYGAWSGTSTGRVGITNTGNDGTFSSALTTVGRAVNVWRNATVVINGTDMIYYLDGKEYARVNGLDVFPKDLEYNAAFLGRSMWNGDRYYTGYMDNFAIFNRALSADEVAAIHATGQMPGIEYPEVEPVEPVVADKDMYLVNEEITLTVTTGTDIVKLGVFNEAGKGISQISKSYVDADDVRTWTVVIKMGTKGDRAVSVKALKEGEAFADVEAIGAASFAVVKVIPPVSEDVVPAIISVEAPETAKAKQAFTFTVKTSKAVTNIGLFNESGAGISTSKSYVDEGDARIWTVNTNVSSRGARVLTVKTATEGSNWLDVATAFNITLTK